MDANVGMRVGLSVDASGIMRVGSNVDASGGTRGLCRMWMRMVEREGWVDCGCECWNERVGSNVDASGGTGRVGSTVDASGRTEMVAVLIRSWNIRRGKYRSVC